MRTINNEFVDSKKVFDRVEQLASKKGLSLARLAKNAGVSWAILYRWRKGVSVPSFGTMEGLCVALDIHISNLFAEDDDWVKLTESQKILFEKWSVLTTPQREIVYQLIETLHQETRRVNSAND